MVFIQAAWDDDLGCNHLGVAKRQILEDLAEATTQVDRQVPPTPYERLSVTVLISDSHGDHKSYGSYKEPKS
jgi:hypothetical protein